MPRRNRNAGGISKQRAKKNRKRDVKDAPLSKFVGHPLKRGGGARRQ